MPTQVRIGPNLTPAELVEVISPTELRARYMGGGADGVPEDVVVTTSAGSTTAAGGFTHRTPPRPPTIESITPDSGPGGTVVTIRGTGFEE